MKVVVKLFSELIRQFPLHFIFLLSLVFLQGPLNAMSLVAVALITKLMLERLDSNNRELIN